MGPMGDKLPPISLSSCSYWTPKLCFLLIKTHSLTDISREFSSDRRPGHGPGVEIHGDHRGHVTEQAKSQARTRSVQGLLARSSKRPRSCRGTETSRKEKHTVISARGPNVPLWGAWLGLWGHFGLKLAGIHCSRQLNQRKAWGCLGSRVPKRGRRLVAGPWRPQPSGQLVAPVDHPLCLSSWRSQTRTLPSPHMDSKTTQQQSAVEGAGRP